MKSSASVNQQEISFSNYCRKIQQENIHECIKNHEIREFFLARMIPGVQYMNACTIMVIETQWG